MNDDARLLQEFTSTRSDAAFAELAKRYVDFVYSSAHRQVRDAHLADDVTQAVFIVLAKKAASVPRDRPMAGWLLKVTSYCAANARRARGHRETHERRAAEMAPNISSEQDWDSLSPLLDEGLSKLRPADRDALLLKFFEKKTLQQVGETLGVSEDAAQKRVTRAVEKLRDYFSRRGVTMSSAALTTELFSKSMQHAPAALAQAVQAPAAGATSAAAIAKGAIILMTAKQTSAVVAVAVILLLGIGGSVAVVNHFRAAPPIVTNEQPVAVAASSQPASELTFPVEFADGTILEVLGISDPTAVPDTWWTANGLPARAPDLRGLGGASVTGMPGTEKRQIALRLTGSAKGETIKIQLEPRLPIAYGTTNDGKTTIVNCVAAVPAKIATTVMKFGLSSGPWDEDESLQVAESQPATLSATPARRIGSITANANATEVSVRIIRDDDRDERVVVELLDGKQVHNTGLFIDLLNNGKYTFPCPKEQVARVVILSRPVEWVEMTNVALRGDGEPTAIAVHRLSTPAERAKL